MTAFARVDDATVAAGITLEFLFDTSLQHGLLHSSGMVLSVPLMGKRLLVMKHAVDAQLWKGALPSIALNRLVCNAYR